MELSEQDLELLEAYYQGSLSKEEVRTLEKRMEADSAFQEEAREWLFILAEGFQPTSNELERRTTLKSKLEAIEAGMSSQGKPTSISMHASMWKIAMAACLVLIVGLYFVFNSQEKEWDIPHLPIENAAVLSTQLSPGEQAYEAKNYDKAWPLLVEEIQSPNDSLNMLYAGVAALQAGEPGKALEYLGYIVRSPEWIDYRPEADWYRALSYLVLDDWETAKIVLEQISQDPQHPYYEEAKERIGTIPSKSH